jgi:hypothetical protein
MANLLSRKDSREPFPTFDEIQRARFEERARCISGLEWPGSARALARSVDGLSLELEELEAAPALAVAHALLDRIDRARRPLLPRAPAPAPASRLRGDWLCYLPGRSLATGEAEIASRGFFDVADRPPPGLWVEAIGRRARGPRDAFELAILCWIPEAALDSARAGRRACRTGSLATLGEVSAALEQQIQRITGVFAPARGEPEPSR